MKYAKNVKPPPLAQQETRKRIRKQHKLNPRPENNKAPPWVVPQGGARFARDPLGLLVSSLGFGLSPRLRYRTWWGTYVRSSPGRAPPRTEAGLWVTEVPLLALLLTHLVRASRGPIWARMGSIWGPCGPTWAHMNPIWVLYGAHMGPMWAPCGAHMGPYKPI